MRILLGEDSNTSDGSVRGLLDAQDAELILCGNGIDAVRKAFLRKPDLIVLDVNLPRMNGYQCARLLKQDPFLKTIPIVHMAPSGNPLDRFWSQVCRGDGYVVTPVDAETWEDVIHGLEFNRRPRRHLISHANMTQSASTGHKVLMTFHTEDTTGALFRLMDMGIDTFLISSTVISVIAQRLVRVLCDECKEAYRRMIGKAGRALESSELMQDFIEFILFTVRRVERSLNTQFVEFSLREKNGKIVMELETMVPEHLPKPAVRKPRDQGPRLINFLLPSQAAAKEDAVSETRRRVGPSTTDMVDGMDEEKMGLYRKHVEELEWEASTGS